MRAAILTLSDKGARGEREDLSGPALSDWLIQQGVVVECMSLIPDDFEQIVSTLEKWIRLSCPRPDPDHGWHGCLAA